MNKVGREMLFRPMSVPEIKNWYSLELRVAFSEQECKPLADIFLLQSQNRYELWGLFKAQSLLGYATIWKAPAVPLALLDYLGVTAAQRNRGIGAHILGLLKAQGRPLILESEEPMDGANITENQLRIRRIGFYLRNGFQPAYRMATCGMAWQALLYDPSGALTQDVMDWHRTIYGPGRTDVRIPLPDGFVPGQPYWIKQKNSNAE